MRVRALTKAIHVSWLIAWLSIGVVLGVIVSAHIPPGFFGEIVWLIVAFGLGAIAVWKKQLWCIAIMLLSGVLFGLWRGSITTEQLTVYRPLIGKTMEIRGVIHDDPDIDKSGMPTYVLEKISIEGHALPGKIWVDMRSENPAQRSDVITIKGMLGKGFANFSATIYRAELLKIKRPVPGDIALQMRDGFAEKVRSGVSDPAASLGLGFLVGQRRALPSELENALRVASLMHIVVASGYNLTILIRLARRLFAKVSKFLAAFISGSLIVSFMAVTGLSPSMSRAGLVAFLSLAAWYYGRKFHPVVLLSFAAAITLLIEPSYGWNDLGWALSFASFAGVMLLAPALQTYFFGDKKPGVARQILGETLSAQAATLPLLVLSFGTVSVVGVFANLLIVPFVPLAMLLTFIAGIGAWLLPSCAQIIGAPAQLLLDAMIWVAEKCANLPWATLEAKWTSLIAVGFYIGLFAVGVWMWRASHLNFREQNLVE